MKRLIFLLFMLPLFVSAQQTFWTTSPSGWTALSSPAFRFKTNSPDSTNRLLIFNPITGKYNELYTATQQNLRFLQKIDSTANSGYVTHGYFNSHLPSTLTYLNGLTKVGSTVKLGGDLTGDTHINLKSHVLNIGSSSIDTTVINLQSILPDGTYGQLFINTSGADLAGYLPGTSTTDLISSGGTVAIRAQDLTTSKTIDFEFSGQPGYPSTLKDEINNMPLEAGGSYEANYDARSYTSKRYVDSVAAATASPTNFIQNQLDSVQAANYRIGGAGIAKQFQAIFDDYGTHHSNWSYKELSFGDVGSSVLFKLHSDTTGNRVTGREITFDTLRTYKKPLTGYDVVNRRSADSLYAASAGGSGYALKDSTLNINKNLYDVPNKATARTNLNVYSTTQTASLIAAAVAGLPSDTTQLARKTGNSSITNLNYKTNGTAGNGYAELISQSVSPSPSTGKLRVYADSLNRLSWKNSTYRRTIRSTRSRDETFTMPFRNDPTLADSTDVANNYAPVSGSANYIQNTVSPQTANFNVSGSGAVGGILSVGGASYSYNNPVIVVSKAVTDPVNSSHGFLDISTINSGRSYASYDIESNILDGINYAGMHNAGFQSNGFNSATQPPDNIFSFTGTFTNNGGLIPNYYGYYLNNPAGTGTYTNKFGIYISPITGASTNNWQIFAAGTTTSSKSYFGGSLVINDTSTPTARLVVKSLSTGAQLTAFKNTLGNNIGTFFERASSDGQFNINSSTGAVNVLLDGGTGTQSYILAGLNVGVASSTATAKLGVLSTAEQLRLQYDASNYLSFTTGSTGITTISPTGTAKGLSFTLGSDATGDIFYRNSTGLFSRLSIGGANTVIHGGTIPSYSAIVNADITNSTIDLTTKVTGSLPVANGGTGSATQNFVDLSSAQASIAGAKGFTAPMTITSTTPSQLTVGYDATNKFTVDVNSSGLATLNAPAGAIQIGSSFGFGNTASNLNSQITFGRTTAASLLFGGASMVAYRVGESGNNTATLTANDSYGGHIIGNQAVTTASSGTSAMVTSLALRPVTLTVTAGSTVTTSSTLHIDGTPTTGSNPVAVSIKGNTSGVIGIATQAAAGTYNYNLPTTAGTTGQVLTSGGGGTTAMTWSNAPLIQASANLTAQSAAGNITTFTVGAATATFNVSAYINVTAVSTDVIQAQVTYTDENSVSQTISFSTISTVTNSSYSPVTIRAKNGTVITVKSNLTVSAGSVTFDAGGTIIQN